MGSDEPSLAASPALSEARANRESVRRAGAELEALVASPALADPSRWGKTVGAGVAALADAFGRHVRATESADGLLAEMVEISPRLAHAAGHIRSDHELLGAEIDNLATACSATGDADAVAAVRGQALDVLRHISEHRHLGVEIVHEAYSVDIEAAD